MGVPTCWVEWNFSIWGGLSLNFPILVDKFSLLFILTVTTIYLRVIIFSSAYIDGDPREWYFTMIVLAFAISMAFLVLVPKLAFALIGWDLLGLTSYLLVVYYSRATSLGAGMLTAITNRLGDGFLILAIAWIFSDNFYIKSRALMGIAIALASITKRAQLPFRAWLPAAIAAPTPVSALVHSSTLVTAGVYLLIRHYEVVQAWSGFAPLILGRGVATCIFASLRACVENDLKKIIALSTLSQLGVIIASLGIGSPCLAFYHLMTHAFFKASLFIRAGNTIHKFETQDIRSIGTLASADPLALASIGASRAALCGLPFLAGFYSKDLIYEKATRRISGAIAIQLYSLGLCLTVAYRLRLLKHISLGSGPGPTIKASAASPARMGPQVLTLLGVVAGAILFWTMEANAQVLPPVSKLWLLVSILTYALALNLFKFPSPMRFLKTLRSPVSKKSIKTGATLRKADLSFMEPSKSVYLSYLHPSKLPKLLSAFRVLLLLVVLFWLSFSINSTTCFEQVGIS